MTFEEFQATRQWADDLQAVKGIELGFAEPAPGFHYHGGLHIFVEGNAEPRSYILTIGNVDEYGETAEDLIDLEHKLYAWGKDEGVID